MAMLLKSEHPLSFVIDYLSYIIAQHNYSNILFMAIGYIAWLHYVLIQILSIFLEPDYIKLLHI